MIDELRAFLDRLLRDRRPEATPLGGGIVLGANKAERLKVVVVFFGPDGRVAAAAKVARGAEGEAALRSENAVLRSVWATGVPAVTGFAPAPLALEVVAGRLVLATTALEGEPMLTGYHTPGHTADPATVEHDFAAAGDWLRRFQQETAAGSVDAAGALTEWLGGVRESYRAIVGWSEDEERIFDGLETRSAAVPGLLPVSATHGDFWMGNLLLSGGAVSGVLDWESGSARGLPFRDLYKFANSYGFYLDRAYAGRTEVPGHPERAEIARAWRLDWAWPNAAGFAYTWFGRSWFPRLVERSIRSFGDALGIDPAVHGVAFQIFLAEQAAALDVERFRQGYRLLLRLFDEHAADSNIVALDGNRVA